MFTLTSDTLQLQGGVHAYIKHNTTPSIDIHSFRLKHCPKLLLLSFMDRFPEVGPTHGSKSSRKLFVQHLRGALSASPQNLDDSLSLGTDSESRKRQLVADESASHHPTNQTDQAWPQGMPRDSYNYITKLFFYCK